LAFVAAAAGVGTFKDLSPHGGTEGRAMEMESDENGGMFSFSFVNKESSAGIMAEVWAFVVNIVEKYFLWMQNACSLPLVFRPSDVVFRLTEPCKKIVHFHLSCHCTCNLQLYLVLHGFV
jgi:hypothetical protein